MGLNLHSSFSNVLKERRFEIGVKRAIGASRKDIIAQLFIEGMVVMGANIIITILAVANIATIWKLVQWVFFGNLWTINLNFYSVILFVFCTAVITLSSSIIFALKSSQVEIIKYIKAE